MIEQYPTTPMGEDRGDGMSAQPEACPECGGNGEVEVSPSGYGNDPRNYSAPCPRCTPCDHCNGHGEIELHGWDGLTWGDCAVCGGTGVQPEDDSDD